MLARQQTTALSNVSLGGEPQMSFGPPRASMYGDDVQRARTSQLIETEEARSRRLDRMFADVLGAQRTTPIAREFQFQQIALASATAPRRDTSVTFDSRYFGLDQPQLRQAPPFVGYQSVPYEQEVRNLLQRANTNFITQEPSQWNLTAPSQNKDCGPATLAMLMKFKGIAPPGVDPYNAEALVRQMRIEMTGGADHNQVTSVGQMREAALRYGVKSTLVQSLSEIDAAIGRGQMVAAMGVPNRRLADGSVAQTWATKLTPDQYEHGSQTHFVLIVGKDSRGNYIVNDPLSKIGALRATPQEMNTFIHAPKAINGGIAFS